MADLNTEKLLHEKINDLLGARLDLVNKNKTATIELNNALSDSINKLNETHAAATFIAETMERAAAAAASLAGTELPESDKFAKSINMAHSKMSGLVNNMQQIINKVKGTTTNVNKLNDVIGDTSSTTDKTHASWTDVSNLLDNIPFVGSKIKDGFNSVFEKLGMSGDDLMKGLSKKFPGIGKKLAGLKGPGLAATTGIAAAATAFKGVVDATNKAFNAAKAYFAFVGRAASMAVSTLWAIWGVWSNITQKIGEAARLVEEWSRQVFAATEGVREKLGDLSQGIGEATMDIVGSFEGLGNLSAGAIFGPYEAGAVAMREFFGEAVADLGNQAEALRGQLVSAGEYFVGLKKGVGLSGEAMSGLAATTFATGKTLKQTFAEVTAGVATLAKKMGVSVKTIGKNLSQIAGNLADFGHLSTQEMMQLSATISKVGIEMKTVLGVAKQFDMFEGAAQSVAKLNQAFGMQLDAMEMMNASDEERMAMLQASFAATGRSISDLDRQERQYLAQQSGVDANELDKFFGNYAESIGAAGDAAADAADQQMSEKEALNDIAKSVKQMLPYFIKATTVLGAFFEGFEQGFLRSPEAREFMQTLREIIRLVFEAGERAGKAFADIMEQAGGFEMLEGWFRSSADALISFSNLIVGLAGDLGKATTPEAKEKAWSDFVDGIIKILEDQYSKFAETFANMLDFISNNDSGPVAKAVEKFATWLRDRIIIGLTAGAPLIGAILVGGLVVGLLAAVPTLLATFAMVSALLVAAFMTGWISVPALIIGAILLAIPLMALAIAAFAGSIILLFEKIVPAIVETFGLEEVYEPWKETFDNMVETAYDFYNTAMVALKAIGSILLALGAVALAMAAPFIAFFAIVSAVFVGFMWIITQALAYFEEWITWGASWIMWLAGVFIQFVGWVTWGIGKFLSYIPGFGSIGKAIMGLGESFIWIGDVVGKFFDKLAAGWNKIQGWLPTWAGGSNDVTPPEDAIPSQTTEEAVTGVGEVEKKTDVAQAKIDDLAKATSVLGRDLDLTAQMPGLKNGRIQLDENYEINAPDANFNINLVVNMEADKVANNLTDKTIVGVGNVLARAGTA
jgi:hypothetical protein